jgi:hypothetical protein
MLPLLHSYPEERTVRKPLLVVLALILIVALPALGQDNTDEPQSELSIPKPAGAVVTMELSMTREQILQQLDAMTTSVPVGTPEMNWDELKAAVVPLDHVEYMEMDIKNKTTPTELLAFFEKQVGGKRVIYNVDPKGIDSQLLLAMPQGGGYLFVGYEAQKDASGKPKAGGKLHAGRVFGSIDATKLAVFAGHAVAKFGDLILQSSK